MTPAAAGALRAVAGLVVGGVAVLLVLVVALLFSSGHSLALHSGSAALLSLGYACASTATIVALARGLRAPTLALVFAIATFWTATALPLWFAIPATALTGLVLIADDRAHGGARIGGRVPAAALAAAAALLLVAGAATAESRPAPATAPHRSVATALLAPAEPRSGTHTAPAKPHATGTHTAPAKPHATGTHTAPSHPAATATPTATAPDAPAKPAGVPPTPAAPADFIRAYYAALDKHRFADAWTRLSSAIKARFGTFAHWRAGYATTLSSTPQDLRVTTAADGSATVRHLLVARDRTSCGGTREQRFVLTWKLVPAGTGWTAASVSASAAGRAAVVSPCP